MKIPKTLKIGANIYNIIFKDMQRNERQRFCGYEDPDFCEIIIDSKQNIQSQETTLIHEIIEAIDYRNELKLKHNQIMVLEHNLYQIFRDNNLLK